MASSLEQLMGLLYDLKKNKLLALGQDFQNQALSDAQSAYQGSLDAYQQAADTYTGQVADRDFDLQYYQNPNNWTYGSNGATGQQWYTDGNNIVYNTSTGLNLLKFNLLAGNTQPRDVTAPTPGDAPSFEFTMPDSPYADATGKMSNLQNLASILGQTIGPAGGGAPQQEFDPYQALRYRR